MLPAAEKEQRKLPKVVVKGLAFRQESLELVEENSDLILSGHSGQPGSPAQSQEPFSNSGAFSQDRPP